MREHLSCLRKNIHVNKYLQNAFNKYGEGSFSFEVYEYVGDIDNLLLVEQRILDELKPYDMKIGYNISKFATSYRVCGEDNHHFGKPKSEAQKRKTSQSLKGHKHSEETKKKISEAVKGKNTGENHWSYGKERSKQHRERFSQSMKGKFAGSNNPSAKKVVQLTKNDELIQIYDTMKEAGIATGIYSSNIVSCCKGKKKTAAGFKWMYYEEYENTRAL